MQLSTLDTVVLTGEGFEEIEFWYPVLRLREVGSSVTVLSVDGAEVVSGRRGYPVIPGAAIGDYEGSPVLVVVPGFVEPERPAIGAAAARLTEWAQGGAVIAAIGNGIGILARAGLLRGRDVSVTAELVPTVEQAGAVVAEAGAVCSGPIASARSVEHVTDLFRLLVSSELAEERA